MKIEIDRKEFELLFERARKCFNDCIAKENNHFLSNELKISLFDIIKIENEVKIIISNKNMDDYLIHVKLMLFNDNKEIGYYTYIENNKEQPIDDFLIFY